MPDVPLPFGSAASRWFYVLYKGLLSRGHEVRAFATYSNQEEKNKALQEFPTLKLYERRSESNFVQKIVSLVKPFSHNFSDEMKADLELEKGKGYDILHLEQTWTAWLDENPDHRSLINIHYLYSLDLADVAAEGFKERALLLQSLEAEKKLVGKFQHISVLSESLKIAVKNLNPASDPHVRALGMDHSLYKYETEDKGDEAMVTLIGSMWWKPSHSAALRLLNKLWGEIKKEVPQARLRIVGREAKTILKEYDQREGIEILENVPDIEPYFKEASVFLYAPESGSGMKVKILEAMLYGAPIVTNQDGVEGLSAVDGEHVFLGETDKEIIDKTVRLLKDAQLQNEMRRKARTLVEETCGPGPTLDRLEEIYHSILK